MILANHGIISSSGASSLPLLLDTYSGASAAYSLRKLNTAYTGYAIRVRRSSDNASQDIGFVNGNLDTTSMLSFVGAGNGFVSIWYDQSGSGNNSTQVTSSNQPQIISSGVLHLVNSKPSIFFNASTQSFLDLTTEFNTGTSSFGSSFNSFVGKRSNAGDLLLGISGGNVGSNYFFGLSTDNNYYLNAKSTAYQASNSTDSTTSQLLLTGINSSGTMSISKNGSIVPSSEVTFTLFTRINCIGKYSAATYATSYLQEIVFYNIDNTSNKTAIETNINTYYSIY